jgi:hypothetical protein
MAAHGRWTALLVAFGAVAACGGRDGLLGAPLGNGGMENGPDAAVGAGGNVGAGGRADAAPLLGTGGALGFGGLGGEGARATGGTAFTGGSTSGGTPATGGAGLGGIRASGGALATGGRMTGGFSLVGGGGAGGTRATGGVVGTGGRPMGGAGGDACMNVKRCGGDVVGNWTVTASCLAVSGHLDPSDWGLNCPSVPVTGALQVSGTWVASGDKYVDKTTTWGDETLTLPPSCLVISGTTVSCVSMGSLLGGSLGYSTMNCTAAANGGCTCSAKVKQAGGMGLLSFDPQIDGHFTTSGGALTTDTDAQYDYCVSGKSMSWTPQSKNPTLTGAIVFQYSGSP